MRKNKKLITCLLTLVFLLQAVPAMALSPCKYSDWKDIPQWAWEQSPKSKAVIFGEFPDAVKYELYAGYPDMTLRPNNPITRAEFAQAMFNVLDLKGTPGTEWYDQAVNALIDQGIIPDRSGNWNEPISRLEMGQWTGQLVMNNQIPLLESVSFTDTDDPKVLAAAAADLIQGRPDGTYGPNDTATRCEAGIMTVRIARSLNDNVPTYEEMKEIDIAVSMAGKEIGKKWFDTKQWDPSPAQGKVSERRIEQLRQALLGGGLRRPNPQARFYSMEIIEAHRNICRVDTIYEDQEPGKTTWFKGPKCATYYRKIDGRWLMTHGE